MAIPVSEEFFFELTYVTGEFNFDKVKLLCYISLIVFL
jgi:hypothetical protein